MRSNAKAASAGTTLACGRSRGILGTACLCILGLVAFLGISAPPAAATCPNEPVRAQQGSTFLPDCRAFEQVTPVDKEAGNDMFGNGYNPSEYGLAAPSGEKVFMQTTTAFGEDAGGFVQGYLFSRSSGGWGMTAFNPPGAGATRYWPNLLSPDLSQVGILTVDGFALPATLAGPESSETLQFGPPGGPYTLIHEFAAGGEGDNHSGAMGEFVGGSSDFSHLVISSLDHTLVPTAEGQDEHSRALYEYSNGQLKLINVKTDGTLTNTCGAFPGGGATNGFTHNAISADGSKIFFVSPDPTVTSLDALFGYPTPPACEEPAQLYVRINGTETIDVSEPEEGVVDPSGPHEVRFEGASEDGSRVFFRTNTELTADDEGIHTPELYEYNLNTETLTRISHGDSGTAEGNVQWTLNAENGSAVYFAAEGEPLAPGAPAEPGGGEGSPFPNFYRYDTETGETTYIATGSNGLDWPTTEAFHGIGPNDISTNWFATPNGRFLVFYSRANITGENPMEAGELYRYDAETGSVVCVSCPPNPEAGNAEFDRLSFHMDLVGSAVRPERPISEDGSRVFFDTPAALVKKDTNERRDVYEWHNGVVSLISSGKDGTDSHFFDSTPSGRDVFFGTHGTLALTDSDFEGDLYDAREGGGFLYSPPAECQGESCQGTATAQPRETTPGSASFIGTGNIHQHHACPRGTRKVRRHGKVRCVRKHHKRHRRAGSNQGGSK